MSRSESLSCPRAVNQYELLSVQARLAEHGVALKTGVECEFFLLDGSAPAARPALSDPFDVQAKPWYDAGNLG